jgi:antitoxin component YwqK of YwqJK toxin-antitoxin module
MKKICCTFLVLWMAHHTYAQKMSPLYEAYFSDPDAMKQDEEGGGYHFDTNDGFKVAMSDDGYYKLSNADGVLLEEGDTDEGDNSFSRHGKWVEYHATGKVKASGNYFQNKPFGHWQFFDSKGNTTSEFDILVIVAEDGTTAYCKGGTELVYYDNGKLKEERFFKAEPYSGEDKIQVEDPETGKKVWSKVAVKAYRPKPFGTWIYYNNDSTIERKEDKKD